MLRDWRRREGPALGQHRAALRGSLGTARGTREQKLNLHTPQPGVTPALRPKRASAWRSPTRRSYRRPTAEKTDLLGALVQPLATTQGGDESGLALTASRA